MPYCAECGQPTEPTEEGHALCSAGHMNYVNPSPAVGVAIVRDGKVLLAKRGRDPEIGQWDMVGGFVDAGETFPEAARREAREETGLELTNLRRLHQAPGEYKPGQPTLNVMYVAEADGDPVAADDVAELRWFPVGELPALAWEHEAVALAKLSIAP